MGQGPGPLGPGAGAPGPKLQDTHGESNYLLSARLPTVRQAISRCQRCTQKPHTCTQTFPHTLHQTTAYFAPNRSIDMHPKGAYMHPKVSAYMHPNSSILLIFEKCKERTQTVD